MEENREEMSKTRPAEPEDDGRTIADMNVEGMPWYVAGDKERAARGGHGSGEQLTDEQVRMYRWAALKAGLLLVLVFGGAFALFIAFCDFVWFS